MSSAARNVQNFPIRSRFAIAFDSYRQVNVRRPYNKLELLIVVSLVHSDLRLSVHAHAEKVVRAVAVFDTARNREEAEAIAARYMCHVGMILVYPSEAPWSASIEDLFARSTRFKEFGLAFF